MKDVGACLNWIDCSERLDGQRVAAYGGSDGGYMSLACLTNYPTRFRGGIDNVGLANFVTFLRDTSDYRRGIDALNTATNANPKSGPSSSASRPRTMRTPSARHY